VRALLITFGSTGDVYPLIALGHALTERGHGVTLGCAESFAGEVEQAGLSFLAIPRNADQETLKSLMREASGLGHPVKILRLMYRSLAPVLPETARAIEAALREHDILLTSYLFPIFTQLAETAGKPACSVAFAHNTVYRLDRPPQGAPRLPLPSPLSRIWNRFWWRGADRYLHRLIEDAAGTALQEAGLEAPRHFFTAPAANVVVAVSPGLFAPPAQAVPETFHFVGYCRWQLPLREGHDSRLEAFTDGEMVPVLTFGSVAFNESREILRRFLANWPKGRKLILQSGWAGLNVDERKRPEILTVGKMPHRTLFSHASVIIHHGGAGTTASALAAGRPQIIIPHIADQWFWAGEIRRLGVGIKLARKHWPERLPAAVDRVSAERRFLRCAHRCQQTLDKENGPVTAAKLVERLARPSSGNRFASEATTAPPGLR
jgi:vancomycin aglycone glucosyltransferase